jgi:hypothetical protein
LEAFAHGLDFDVWHTAQLSPGSGQWTPFTSLGGDVISDPSVGVNADGRLEVFGRGRDNALWHNWQATAGGVWLGWYSAGGILSEGAAPALNANGLLDIFARRPDNTLWHIEQSSPGTWN